MSKLSDVQFGDVVYWDKLNSYLSINDNIDKIRATTRDEKIWRVGVIVGSMSDLRIATFSRRRLTYQFTDKDFINVPKVVKTRSDELGIDDFINKFSNLNSYSSKVNSNEEWINLLRNLYFGTRFVNKCKTNDQFIKLLENVYGDKNV